jgi:hypothetical protein
MTLLDEQSDRHWTVYHRDVLDHKEAKDLFIAKKGNLVDLLTQKN